jgi:hypothetical protein
MLKKQVNWPIKKLMKQVKAFKEAKDVGFYAWA